MAIAAGRLDRRIRIEKSALVDDGYQTRPGDFETLTTVWAQYRPSEASVRADLAAREAKMPVAFLIRYLGKAKELYQPVAGAAYRVRFPAKDSGSVYDIIGVTVTQARDGLELQCVAVADA